LGKAARSKTAVRRFLTEAKSIAALNHNNIVQIYDYGRATDGPFLIMECVQGGSLLDQCRKGPIEVNEAVRIFGQVCDGLAKAHAAGIIHRDIKPANVLMTEDGIPKLTDFGLAKDDTADTGMTMEGAVIGTLDFMPPEQRQAAELTDHRSDLWSLAATFYQMLTGKSPKVINITSLPQKLQSVVAKALEESKEERFQSAMEMREAILQAHSGKMDAKRTLGEGECPQCAAPNPTHGKFCVGCGAVLQIQCLQCEAEIQIWNRACGECGSLQEPLVEKALADLKQIHDEAESLLAELEFDSAAKKAAVVASETDSRLQQFAPWHEEFLVRIESSRTSEHARLVQLLQEALVHEQAYDYEAGLQTLGQVAPSLKRTNSIGISDTAEELNERLTTKQSRLKELEGIVRERLTKDEHKGLLPLVDELLALKPDRPERRKLRAHLVKREEFITFLQNGDYEGALSLDPNSGKALAMKKTADIETAFASGDYEKVLSLDPSNLRAITLKKAVEIKAALDIGDYENALSLDPNNSKALAMKKTADIKAALDDIAVKLSSILSGNESTTEIVSMIVDGDPDPDLTGDDIQYIAKEIRSKFTLAKRLPNLIASWGIAPEIGDRCSPEFLLVCGEDYSDGDLDVKFDLDEQLDFRESHTKPTPIINAEGHWIFRFPFNLTTDGEDCNPGMYNMTLELNFAGLADPLLPTSLYCDIRLTIPGDDAEERVLEIDSDDKSLVNLQGLNLRSFSKIKLKGSGSGLINMLQGAEDDSNDDGDSLDADITQAYTLQVASKDEGNPTPRPNQ
jgi:hypothetical protein